MSDFAIGSRSVPPVFIGLSLAANMTSVATFVINPGLVHAYGWAGVMGYGIAAPLGIFLGLVVMTKHLNERRSSSASVVFQLSKDFERPELALPLAGGKNLDQSRHCLIIHSADCLQSPVTHLCDLGIRISKTMNQGDCCSPRLSSHRPQILRSIIANQPCR